MNRRMSFEEFQAEEAREAKEAREEAAARRKAWYERTKGMSYEELEADRRREANKRDWESLKQGIKDWGLGGVFAFLTILIAPGLIFTEGERPTYAWYEWVWAVSTVVSCYGVVCRGWCWKSRKDRKMDGVYAWWGL